MSPGSDLSAADFSSEDESIVLGGVDGTARIWSAVTGKMVGDFIKHPSMITIAKLGPDGRLILIGGGDGTSRLWDVTTERPIGQPMIQRGAIQQALFTENNQTVWVLSEGGVRLWDTLAGHPLGPPLEGLGVSDLIRPQPNERRILGISRTRS